MVRHPLAVPSPAGWAWGRSICLGQGSRWGGWLLPGVPVTLLSSSASPPGVRGSGTPAYPVTDCSRSAFSAAGVRSFSRHLAAFNEVWGLWEVCWGLERGESSPCGAWSRERLRRGSTSFSPVGWVSSSRSPPRSAPDFQASPARWAQKALPFCGDSALTGFPWIVSTSKHCVAVC